MVFGFFTRKAPEPTIIVEAGPSTTTQFQFPKQQHTPAPSIDSSSSQHQQLLPVPKVAHQLSPEASEPAITPSPPPEELITDPSALHALIASVPAQTLHAYTLAHLASSQASSSSYPLTHPTSGLILPTPPPPPSPRTIKTLTAFFSSLTAPPKLHCVRCHKHYFELENSDRSCLVPHDDDSAIVERVRTGLGTEYETLWGCCGRTVEGDGDMGPPDGWCYEGRHTADPKRARFRADSTPSDDKLSSCATLRCHDPPMPSRASRSRKRARGSDAVDNDAEEGSVASSSSRPIRGRGSAAKGHKKSVSISSATRTMKGKGRADDTDVELSGASGRDDDEDAKPRPTKRVRSRKTSTIAIIPRKEEEEESGPENDADAMDVDSPPSPPKSPPIRRVASKPRSKPAPKPATATTPSSPPRSQKPRSAGSATSTRPVQKSPLSASFTAATPPPMPKPRTATDSPTRNSSPRRSPRKVEVEIQPIVNEKPLTRKGSAASLRAVGKKGSVENLSLRKQATTKPKTTVRQHMKTRALGEVVDTSVEGERDL